jgi:hypothetical protein
MKMPLNLWTAFWLIAAAGFLAAAVRETPAPEAGNEKIARAIGRR